MRSTLFFLIFISFYSFAQTESPKKNYINLNLGNSTPILGINYNRGFGYHKENARHFELGLGVGGFPAFIHTKPLRVLSHNFSYCRGKGKTFATVGYNGIFSEKGQLNDASIYTPNPFIGGRLAFKKLVLNLNLNLYYSSDRSFFIKNENELFQLTRRHLYGIFGASIGFKFY